MGERAKIQKYAELPVVSGILPEDVQNVESWGMLDEGAGFLKAVVTSVVAVALNFRTMLIWAMMIVVFTGAGLIAGYIGLALTLPLIGHASWHAYRGLIKRKG